jgi:hypothetical protein
MIISKHILRNTPASALVLFGLVAFLLPCRGGFDEPTVMNQPSTQTVRDPYFGDYEGTYAFSDTSVADGAPAPAAAEAKVVAEGNHRYRIVLRAKPLDPSEWPLQIELPGRLEGEKIVVDGHAGGHDWRGQIAGGALSIAKQSYGGGFEMKRVIKKSPTEGLPPPPGAIVLLAYQPGQKPSLDEWKDSGWVATHEGIVHRAAEGGKRGDLFSKRDFRNVRLHVEFRIPYEPDFREQERGNSGVILAERYEVQVLDSYGLAPGAGDCAAIYDVAQPRVNAAFPPLSWQTYDITFYAPKLDDAGKLIRRPEFTVLWNGVKVQENQTAATPTGDPHRANAASGSLRLQDHGNLVYFRNVWLQELPDKPE